MPRVGLLVYSSFWFTGISKLEIQVGVSFYSFVIPQMRSVIKSTFVVFSGSSSFPSPLFCLCSVRISCLSLLLILYIVFQKNTNISTIVQVVYCPKVLHSNFRNCRFVYLLWQSSVRWQ